MSSPTTNCYEKRQVNISEQSKAIYTGRRAVGTEYVEIPKVRVLMMIVLQILLRLLLAQSYPLFIIIIDNFMFNETIFLSAFRHFYGSQRYFWKFQLFQESKHTSGLHIFSKFSVVFEISSSSGFMSFGT